MAWLTGEVHQARLLVLAILGLLVLVAAARTWHRSGGALVPTLTVLVAGGVVMWGVNNTAWFQGKVGEEANHTATSVVQLHLTAAKPATSQLLR